MMTDLGEMWRKEMDNVTLFTLSAPIKISIKIMAGREGEKKQNCLPPVGERVDSSQSKWRNEFFQPQAKIIHRAVSWYYLLVVVWMSLLLGVGSSIGQKKLEAKEEKI